MPFGEFPKNFVSADFYKNPLIIRKKSRSKRPKEAVLNGSKKEITKKVENSLLEAQRLGRPKRKDRGGREGRPDVIKQVGQPFFLRKLRREGGKGT